MEIFPLIKLGTNHTNLAISPTLDPNATHLDHSLRKIEIKPQTHQAPEAAGVVLNNGLSDGIAPKPLIRLQHGVSVPDVLEEAGVELGRSVLVEGHPVRPVTRLGALALELGQERRAHRRVGVSRRSEVIEAVLEESAICLPYGVGPN